MGWDEWMDDDGTVYVMYACVIERIINIKNNHGTIIRRGSKNYNKNQTTGREYSRL